MLKELQDGYALKSTGASSSSGSLLEVGAAGDVQVVSGGVGE